VIMDPLQPLYDLILPVIPENYKILAQSWGLYGPVGGIVAFIAAALLLFGLFWLGMILSFGKLISNGEKEYLRKALILIAATLGIIGAWYGAGVMFYIMSNLIYLVGMFIVIIVLAAVARALLGGWYAAGATKEEAYKKYLEAKRETMLQKYIDIIDLVGYLKAQGYNTDQIVDKFKKDMPEVWKWLKKKFSGNERAIKDFINKIPRK